MTKVARRPASGKPHDAAHSLDCALPAPSPGVFRLLNLLKRPVPVSQLRPVATAAGMAEPELAAAISTATRRQAIGLAAVAGVACYVRRGRGI